MNSKRIVLAVVAGFVMLASAQCQKKEAGPTSTEENKALTDRFAEAWIEGDLAAMDELLAPNFVNHAAVPGVTPDREGYKKFATMHHTGFPDFDVKVEDVVAEGDKVARRVTWTGTHKGNYMGIAPTGKQVKVTVITIERIEGGKIAEQWGEADMLGLIQQLGVMPSPPEAKGRP
jgi:steroid delta-isomerase-like uncharacterized protein